MAFVTLRVLVCLQSRGSCFLNFFLYLVLVCRPVWPRRPDHEVACEQHLGLMCAMVLKQGVELKEMLDYLASCWHEDEMTQWHGAWAKACAKGRATALRAP